jgi:hypothetical protein
MLIEKHFIDAKQKEASEKRHQEEMKEYINEWGMAKSFYREEVEKKQGVKNLIGYLETHKPKDKRKLYLEQLEELNNNNGNNNIEDANNNNAGATNINIEDPLLSGTVLANTMTSISEKKPEIIPEYAEAEKFLDNLIESNITHQKHDKILEEVKIKEKVPADLVTTMKTNKIYQVRKNFGTLCELKEIDNEKKSNEDYCPLSIYDNMNAHVLSYERHTNRTINQNNNNTNNQNINNIRPPIRPSSHEFVKRNIGCGSYLDLRKTVTNFKCTEMEKIHESLTKSNYNVNLEQVKKAFLPPVESGNYGKFFLPLPGYGMVARPEEVKKKKKKITSARR